MEKQVEHTREKKKTKTNKQTNKNSQNEQIKILGILGKQGQTCLHGYLAALLFAVFPTIIFPNLEMKNCVVMRIK